MNKFHVSKKHMLDIDIKNTRVYSDANKYRKKSTYEIGNDIKLEYSICNCILNEEFF